MPPLSENPYIHRDGSPRPQLSITCLIDVLGYSAFIAETARAAYVSRVSELKRVLDRAYASAVCASTASRWQPASSTFKAFTDNILIATPFNPRDIAIGEIELGNMLEIASSVQLSLLEDGFLSRGGIGVGWCYLDDRMGFGGGLVDAALGDVKGGPPSVRLSAAAVELLKRHAGFYGEGWWPQMAWLRTQPDGNAIVNFYQSMLVDVGVGRVNIKGLRDVRDRLSGALARYAANNSILEKYEWASSLYSDALATALFDARRADEAGIANQLEGITPVAAANPCLFAPSSVDRTPPGDDLSPILRAAFDPPGR